MKKIVFIFVLTLVSIQKIQSASNNSHPRNVIDFAEAELGGIFQNDNTNMSLFSHFLKKAGVVKEKSRDPLYLIHEIRMLIIKTRTKVTEIISNNNIFLMKKCGQAADKKVLTMDTNAQTAINIWLDDLYVTFKPFETDYFIVFDRVTAINNKTAAMYNRCDHEFPNDQEKYQKCVNDFLESKEFKAEVEEVTKLLYDLNAAMKQPMDEAGEIFEQSMENLYLSITKQSELIVDKHLLSCYGSY